MTTLTAHTASRCPGAAFAMTATPAVAQFQDHMGMWNGTWGWRHAVAGSLVMLLFWGGLIVLIALLVRRLNAERRVDRGAQPPRIDALDVLEERFARGELDREEFEERRRILLASRASGKRRAW